MELPACVHVCVNVYSQAQDGSYKIDLAKSVNVYCMSCLQLMMKAHQYLVSKGKVSSSEGSFKTQLYDLWFKVS